MVLNLVALLGDFMSVMTTILYIGIAILVLLLMITIHELGHYTFGKIFHFKINEFAIGFGKAIFQKKLKSGELFSIRIFPLGGYCAFAGEDEEDKDPGAFNNQKPWKRLIVQFGGVLFNFLSAIIFAFILLVSFGYDIPRVDSVGDYYIQQAQESGHDILESGDVIRQVNGVNVDYVTGNSFVTMVAQYEIGDNFTLTVDRNINGTMQSVTLNVTKYADPNNAENTSGVLGVTKTSAYTYNFIEALIKCVPLTLAMAWQVLVFLFMLITGQVGIHDIGGPITTISTIAEYSQINIANLFVFLPFIAVNLAVFNFLPFPALDGARMVFTTIEWVRKKPVNRNVEGMIHFVGLCILLAFVVIVDIVHFIS